MKIFFIFSLMAIFTHASYIQMLNYAKQNQHQEVLNEAKYSVEDYQNPKLHLLWAKSAQKLEKTTVAMSAYERVLILEPENQEAKDALEHIYTQTHRKGLLVNPYKGSKKNKLRARASLNLGHDTNINVNASGDELDGYYGIELGLKKISTYFARTTANIMYLYNFEEYDNWFAQSSLDMHYQNNFSTHLYDLTVPTISIALGYVKDDYLFYFPISYNNINYLNSDLLNIFAFTPRMRISLQKNILWDTSVIYSQRNYINNIDIGKNASTYGLETGLYWNHNHAQFNVSAKYESRSADHNNNDRYVDADFFTLDGNVKYYFSSSSIVEAKYFFRYSDYSDNIGTKATPSDIIRNDYINELGLKFSYLVTKDMEVYLHDIYTKSLSTYIPSEYNKNVFLFGVQVRY